MSKSLKRRVRKALEVILLQYGISHEELLADLCVAVEKELYPDYVLDGGMISFWMKRRDLTSEKLAEKAEISKYSMSRILQNNLIPRSDVLIRIAKILRVSVSDFLVLNEKYE